MRASSIGTLDWVERSAGRIGVYKLGGVMLAWIAVDDEGRILPKGDYIARFDTHADAISFATEQATIQALAARFTIPPESPAARAMKEPTC